VKSFQRDYKAYPHGLSILASDLDQAFTFYLFPAIHWRRLRTSNKLERLNLEIRRRLNSIGRHPDETGCLTLIQQVTTRYAKDTRGVSVTE
ncbi:transposase, partial [Pseudomonas sp. MPR-R2A6]|uniref:transposase n=1 Tax=Pseudomonas sp. MPR-R2A6 TaxID=2070627 RepID=UPI000CA76C51